jgi:dipeptidyl-peptidase-4
MTASRRFDLASVIVAVLLLSPGLGRASFATQALSLERVSSVPRLSGTPPVPGAWSKDGQRLAFLWNDKGLPFLDVWLTDAEAAPSRVTRLAEDHGEGVLSHRGVSEVVWSPDGATLVFLVDGGIHRIRTDGTGLEQLSTAAARRAITFSHEGRFFSYLENGDLWLWHQASGERVRITRLGRPPIGVVPGARFSRPDAEIVSYLWSPDGRWIALLVEDRTEVRKVLIPDYLGEETSATALRRDFPGDNDASQRLGLYSVEGGRLQWIALAGSRDRWIGGYVWSPDGSLLLVDQHSENAVERWLHLVVPPDGDIRQLYYERRDTRVSWHWSSLWTSDGRSVLFVSDADGHHHLFLVGLDGTPPRQLTSGDWSVIGESGAAWLGVRPSKNEVLFVANRKSPYERHVYRMPQQGGDLSEVTSLPGTHHPFPSPDGARLALLHSSDLSPPELYVVEVNGGAERRVTRSPDPEFYRYSWVAPRYVTFPSHVDGTTLHGRLLLPPNLDSARRYAAILGPVYPNTVRNRWGDREEWRGLYSSLEQYLVLERGYVLLQVDVRGSVGYGRAFQERLLMDYGGIDVDDLESGARYLKGQSYIDPKRIGIWGSSYGGLLTAMSLMRKPHLYAAGVAAAPATNVRHATPHEVRVCRRPEAHPEVYRRSSVVDWGEELSDPLLILHGMRDSIVLFQDSVVLAEKLMNLGKDFDMVIAPSASHTWSEAPHVARHFLRKLVDYFELHLAKDDP